LFCYLLKTVYNSGSPIIVNWKCVNGGTDSYDWLAIFPIGDSGQNYVSWNWRGTTSDQGTVSLNCSSFGQYIVRYIRGSTCIAESKPFVHGPNVIVNSYIDDQKIVVNWDILSEDVQNRSWVGLYKKK